MANSLSLRGLTFALGYCLIRVEMDCWILFLFDFKCFTRPYHAAVPVFAYCYYVIYSICDRDETNNLA